MTPKLHILPEAFIVPAMAALRIDTFDEALFRKFVLLKSQQHDELWADFLQEEAIERLKARIPSMRTMIRHTPLENRAKNALAAAGIDTVGELMKYSPDELGRINGLGKKTIQEIADYLVTVTV